MPWRVPSASGPKVEGGRSPSRRRKARRPGGMPRRVGDGCLGAEVLDGRMAVAAGLGLGRTGPRRRRRSKRSRLGELVGRAGDRRAGPRPPRIPGYAVLSARDWAPPRLRSLRPLRQAESEEPRRPARPETGWALAADGSGQARRSRPSRRGPASRRPPEPEVSESECVSSGPAAPTGAAWRLPAVPRWPMRRCDHAPAASLGGRRRLRPEEPAGCRNRGRMPRLPAGRRDRS